MLSASCAVLPEISVKHITVCATEIPKPMQVLAAPFVVPPKEPSKEITMRAAEVRSRMYVASSQACDTESVKKKKRQ